MESYLRQNQLKYQRIQALTEKDVKKFVKSKITSVYNQLKPNLKEIACIASHLVAMHTAIRSYDQSLKESASSFSKASLPPYALIVEDDIMFEFDFNLKELVEHAPSNWTILQLTSSNLRKVKGLWNEYLNLSSSLSPSVSPPPSLSFRASISAFLSYFRSSKTETHHHLWYERSWNSLLWSTQGYLINIPHLRMILDSQVITTSSPGFSPLSSMVPLSPCRSSLWSFSTSRCLTASTPNSVHSALLADVRNPVREQLVMINLTKPSQIPCDYIENGECMLPFRLVADIYLYSRFFPTYISRIPLLNGASVHDLTSFRELTTIQEGKDKRIAAELLHYKMFQGLRHLVNDICDENHDFLRLLPSYIRCKKRQSTPHIDFDKIEVELEKIESGKAEN
jgi:GR25 family glycosyltransferase involved in LPS biosynthesis